MNKLECGCELSPTGALVSICPLHGEYMRAATAIAVREMGRKPVSPTDETNRELERALTLAIAPVIVSRQVSAGAMDPDTAAQQVYTYVSKILQALQ